MPRTHGMRYLTGWRLTALSVKAKGNGYAEFLDTPLLREIDHTAPHLVLHWSGEEVVTCLVLVFLRRGMVRCLVDMEAADFDGLRSVQADLKDLGKCWLWN